MYYVYILHSINFPNQIYIGYTKDLNQRITAHNSGKAIHTSKYKPWKIITALLFKSEEKAKEVELYFKTQSGRAFIKKRLM